MGEMKRFNVEAWRAYQAKKAAEDAAFKEKMRRRSEERARTETRIPISPGSNFYRIPGRPGIRGGWGARRAPAPAPVPPTPPAPKGLVDERGFPTGRQAPAPGGLYASQYSQQQAEPAAPPPLPSPSGLAQPSTNAFPQDQQAQNNRNPIPRIPGYVQPPYTFDR